MLAEPGMALGDCRIEWADGGVSRDRAATQAAIAEAVGRYVAARTGTQGELEV
jgi:flagellar assembly protein FliH